MKKKVGSTRTRTRTRTRRSLAADILETPIAKASTPMQSPKSTILNDFNKRQRKTDTGIGASVFDPFKSSSFHTPQKPLGSISDLKDLAYSQIEDLKRHIERSHSEIVKDLDSSYSRLHKRFKIQSQACQQMTDETEKEYKNMSARISESEEAVMTSYAEFVQDVQASTSHACKTSITKLSQSFEKAIDGLRSRYGITST